MLRGNVCDMNQNTQLIYALEELEKRTGEDGCWTEYNPLLGPWEFILDGETLQCGAALYDQLRLDEQAMCN